MARSRDSVLFVGTGAGNDIFSGELAARNLLRCGFSWSNYDLAGIISPFHRHVLEPTAHPLVFRTTPTSKRYVSRRDGEREIPFIDAQVARMVREKASDAGKVLALSVERGSEGLADAFDHLASEYDRIMLVDNGGDIFYSGRDPHVLSPMFDAMTLRGFTDSGVVGGLFAFGFGSDGELEPEALHAALAAFPNKDRSHGPLCHRPLRDWERLFQRYIEPVRTGNTVTVTLQANRAGKDEPELRRKYDARTKIGDRRWLAPFEQRIDTKLCKRYYLLDAKHVVNPFAVNCRSPGEWFLRTQLLQHRTNNEANLQYVREADGSLTQFLTPSPLFGEDAKQEMFQVGLTDLLHGVCDAALIFAEDWSYLRGKWERALNVQDGRLVKVWRK